MRSTCTCGALDCARCHPGAARPIYCHGCGAATAAYRFDDDGWRELNQRDYCGECYSERMDALKCAMQGVVAQCGLPEQLSVTVEEDCRDIGDACVVIEQAQDLYVERLQDVLEGMRLAADALGLGISVKLIARERRTKK